MKGSNEFLFRFNGEDLVDFGAICKESAHLADTSADLQNTTMQERFEFLDQRGAIIFGLGKSREFKILVERGH